MELVSGDADPPATSHPLLEGDDVFIDIHLAWLRPSPEYPRAYVVPHRPPLGDLVSSRDDTAAVFRAYAEHGYSMHQLATHLGCGVTTIHRRVREHETRLRLEPTAAS